MQNDESRTGFLFVCQITGINVLVKKEHRCILHHFPSKHEPLIFGQTVWARASSWTIGLILLAPPRAKRKERKLTPIDYTNSEEIVSFVAKPKTSCRTRDLNQPIDKTEIETFRERCIISELALASQEFDM